MSFFGKRYLDKTDKEELRLRQEQINRQLLIVNSLEASKQSWIMGKYSKYGLDAGKQWSINVMTGKITEKKEEKKK